MLEIEIKPFVLHLMPEEEAYLCPVRALADWISASGITSGYLFRRMASGDRPSARDSPMVSTYVHATIYYVNASCLLFRPLSNFLKSSGRTSLILVSTPLHMVPTHSDVGAVNGLHLFDGGSFDEYVTGVGGVPSFQISQLSNT